MELLSSDYNSEIERLISKCESQIRPCFQNFIQAATLSNCKE